MFLVVFLSMAATVPAVIHAAVTPLTKGCCGPRRFTANMQVVGATEKPGDTPQMVDSMVLLDYDYDLKMERFQAKSRNAVTGKISNYDIYVDYNKSKTFTVANGMCFTGPVTTTLQNPCLKANATYMGSYTLGDGAKTVMIDNWSEKIDGQTTHLQVQTETCHIVSMTTYGSISGVQEMMSYTFLSVKPDTLSAVDTFNMPDSCKYAISVPIGK